MGRTTARLNTNTSVTIKTSVTAASTAARRSRNACRSAMTSFMEKSAKALATTFPRESVMGAPAEASQPNSS